jgi:hypothetical protein
METARASGGEAMNADALRKFIELTRRRRELEEQLDDVKQEIAVLEQSLIDQFAQEGINRVSMDGATVYLKRELWASARDGDWQRACAALKEAGLGHYVEEKFNVLSLSAFVREVDRNGDQLPPALADAIAVTEKYSLRVTGIQRQAAGSRAAGGPGAATGPN